MNYICLFVFLFCIVSVSIVEFKEDTGLSKMAAVVGPKYVVLLNSKEWSD